MSRIVPVLSAALCLASCATTSGQAGGGTTAEKQKIANLTYFDLVNCAARAMDVPRPINKEGVTGFLVAARPQVMECLVDAKNRGPEKATKAQVTTSVTEAGVEHKVSGENLTPEGQKC